MYDVVTILTPIHYIYLIGVITILTVMILRKDTPLICLFFLFLLGLAGSGSITGGIQTVFRSILYAAGQFLEIIITISLITAFSKCLSELGSDYLMMKPMSKIMKNPSVTWWIIGIVMMISSLFLWPSPSVALVGAIMLPFAIKKGLKPLAAAMAMNLFGHGIALSYDFIIQGAPSICATAAGIDALDIIKQGFPLFTVMSITTAVSAFFLIGMDLKVNIPVQKNNIQFIAQEIKAPTIGGKTLAFITPLAFMADLYLMFLFDIKGGDACSLISGTTVILLVIGSVLGFQNQSLEKVTSYLTDGFLFGIRIFAPVIIIGAFFFIGGEGITNILGKSYGNGILNDIALWLASMAPLNKYLVAFLQMVIGGLTGLDGSGFSGLPLCGSLAQTFGTAVNTSVPLLATLGQITSIFVGGGTIVPWGLIPVAAICNISPIELARKNFIPVLIGFICTYVVACFLL